MTKSQKDTSDMNTQEFHEKFDDLPTLTEALMGDAVGVIYQTTWNDAVYNAITDMYSQAIKIPTAIEFGLLDDANFDDVASILSVLEDCVAMAWESHEAEQHIERDKELLTAGAIALAYLINDARDEHGDDASEAINDAVLNMMLDRQAKYGPGNIMRRTQLGIMIRMEDKLSRLANGQQDFDDDAWIDGFYDIVGYTLIVMMLQRGTFLLPLRDAE